MSAGPVQFGLRQFSRYITIGARARTRSSHPVPQLLRSPREQVTLDTARYATNGAVKFREDEEDVSAHEIRRAELSLESRGEQDV
jgi:hypothetical protein